MVDSRFDSGRGDVDLADACITAIVGLTALVLFGALGYMLWNRPDPEEDRDALSRAADEQAGRNWSRHHRGGLW